MTNHSSANNTDKNSKTNILYMVITFITLVLISTKLMCLDHLLQFPFNVSALFIILELFVLFCFSSELFLRLSKKLESKYTSVNNKNLTNELLLIDIIAIFFTILSVIILIADYHYNIKENDFNNIWISIITSLQLLFVFFKFSRHSSFLSILLCIFITEFLSFTLIITLLLMLILSSSSIIISMEKYSLSLSVNEEVHQNKQKNHSTNINDKTINSTDIQNNPTNEQYITNEEGALWWALATVTTVGYGDIVPSSILGKLVGAFFAVTSIAIAALPAGILASRFIQFREEESEIKKLKDKLEKLEDTIKKKGNN